MRTAVLERPGPLGRFHEHVVEFLRPVQLPPLAGNGAQPQDKGTVDNGASPSSRHNVWPLRTVRALTALQAHAHQGRDQGATVSVHTPTGQPPTPRCDPPAMRPFPALVPDCRETAHAKVPTACSMRFDGPTAPVPPWRLGQSITGKADHHHVTGSCKDTPVATHVRGWQRQQRLALPQHREAVHKPHRRHWYAQEGAAFLA